MEAHIEHIGDIAVVTLGTDQFNRDTANQLEADLASLMPFTSRVVLDMTHLRRIDSAGLGALLSYLKRLNAKGGDLKLCGVNKSVRILLEHVRMHQLLDMYKNKDEAVHATLWECPWKMLDIVLTPHDQIRRLSHAWTF